MSVILTESDDNSLPGSCNAGPNGTCSDEPEYIPAKLPANTNPRKGLSYFNAALFAAEQLGHQGNARRRFFHGPGINNSDMAMLKDLKLTEECSLEVRAGFFDVFNAASFMARLRSTV